MDCIAWHKPHAGMRVYCPHVHIDKTYDTIHRQNGCMRINCLKGM